MNDEHKLAAFIRETVRSGAVRGVEHPFAEAARKFTADVDVLGKTSVTAWFEANETHAELINQVYEAYHAEPVTEATEPVEEADRAVSELQALAQRVAALEAAQPAEVEEVEDAEVEPETEEEAADNAEDEPAEEA